MGVQDFQRDELSRLLREMREASGMSGREVAAGTDISQSKLSKIENGLLLPTFDDIRSLARALHADDGQRDEALDLLRVLRDETESARVILKRGAYRQQQKIARIEAATTVQRAFDLGAVIGLLQTPEYMRRIFSRGMPDGERDKAVAVRLERLSVLEDEAKQFLFVMTEGALRWRAGSGEMMAEQIKHIAEVSRRPNVRVGIIPWTREVHVFPGHEFHIYDERAVITATETATALIEDPRDITAYIELFAELESLAVFGDTAHAELMRIAADYRALDT